MRNICLYLICLSGVLWSGLALAQDSTERARAVQQMMRAVQSADWAQAQSAATQAGPVASDILEWHRLRAASVPELDNGQPARSFAKYRDFLTRNDDWPGLPFLKMRGEGAITAQTASDDVLAYFGTGIPQTANGFLRLIEAYRATALSSEAETLSLLGWRSYDLSDEVETALLALYPDVLAPHHQARLDDLLWRDRTEAAQRMLPLVSEGQRVLALARIGLKQQVPGVDALIEAVPADLQSDAGLAYDRFIWRTSKGRTDDAIGLLRERSSGPDALGRPAEWSNWRRIYARKLMRDGAFTQAYGIASAHFLLEGAAYADLEWLSGFIALRFLADPELALLHFDHFRQAVGTPISLGRAGYWQGRAHAALGNTDAANAAYRFGAQYQSSYYGLLSAEAIGLPLDPVFAPQNEAFPALSTAPFASSQVLAAALILYEAGSTDLAERFLTHLTETQDRTGAGQLAALALALDEPHIALMIAKRAADTGIVLPDAYYPLYDRAAVDLPVTQELALAIARRESEFDPTVISGAGARGLMQVMPGTAREVASELGLEYDLGRLTSDPDYNLKLGAQYLANLIARFGSSSVLVAAGYNAGPSRPERWMTEQGDPRTPTVDIVDWVELIQYRETRNYVMRVAEALPIYAARLGRGGGPVKLTDLLKGQ